MAEMTVTTALSTLKTLFNDLKEVYYKSTEITSDDLEGASFSMDIELPVLDDGVTFDTGTADVTRVRLTTQEIWTSKATQGDPDITFQIASVDGKVNDLFLENKGEVTATTFTIDGNTYSGAGYSLAPKKVTGSLMMKSEDRQTVIILPSVEIYANLVASDGNNPAYFNIAVTPVKNSEGKDVFILKKTTPGVGG